MGIEDLTQLEIIDGIMGLIYPAVGILVGAIIASKYFKYKRKELLLVGICLMNVGTSYLALGLTFITVVFFNYVLDDTIFFILHFGFGNITLPLWIWAMCILLVPQHTKKIVLIYTVICSILLTFVWVSIFTNPSLIATRVSKMDVDRSPIMGLMSLFSLSTILVTMILFIRQSLKTENLKTVWKGRFLLISTVLLVVGGLVVAANPTNLTIIIISRVIILARMPFSYIGWLMPDRVAKWLIKEEV